MRLLGRHWWATRLGQQAMGCRAGWAKALAGWAEGRREGQAGLLRRLGQAGHVRASGPEGRSGELGRGREGQAS